MLLVSPICRIWLIKTAALMMKFFLFSSLAHLYLIVSSSVMPQYGDTEQKQYDDFMLMSAFHKYLTVPTHDSYSSFRFYVNEYYNRSPIDCLNLMGRYRSNRVFNVLFWQALDGSYEFIDPTKITPGYYTEVLEWITQIIRWMLFNCSCSDETKFKTKLETISLMIKSAEWAATELKSLGNNYKLISGFDNLVATWKYLIRNISIDFTNKTIDCYSLFRTFNDVSILVKTDSSSNGPSLRLSKRYALLWFYLRYIFNNKCNVIFDIHHHHKTLIIYLFMEVNGNGTCKNGINELYPNMLRFLFENLYENVPQKLEHIKKLVREYNLENYRNLLGVSRKILNYSDLARFITESPEKNYWLITWKVRALAELDAYLILNGQKIDYSTK